MLSLKILEQRLTKTAKKIAAREALILKLNL